MDLAKLLSSVADDLLCGLDQNPDEDENCDNFNEDIRNLLGPMTHSTPVRDGWSAVRDEVCYCSSVTTAGDGRRPNDDDQVNDSFVLKSLK